MSKPEESLIVKDQAQPDLLPTAPDSFFIEMEVKGNFTGERLHAQRPDTYKAIVVLLGQKMGVIQIGKLLQVSPNTVMAVRDREGVTIDMVKEHLARVAHAGATLASEGILECLNEVLSRRPCLGVKDLKDLAVVYGILVQNGQLLAGQPTARLEVADMRAPEHDDFNRYVQGLKPITEIHSGAEKSALKETPQDPQETRPGPLERADQAGDHTGQMDSIRPGTDADSDGKTTKTQ